ncbi:hypothetical protein H6P81_000480 [Aristolochia fimbriata]|uniref:Protein kinase domain-containing protein n=1 Tax=Aristolochia fimbriata TaxID=158543 RepID=A0AAV7F864_ARIFI|nr:hypothetical protein H6P81_000480 [Aristolochia fimbriata]
MAIIVGLPDCFLRISDVQGISRWVIFAADGNCHHVIVISDASNRRLMSGSRVQPFGSNSGVGYGVLVDYPRRHEWVRIGFSQPSILTQMCNRGLDCLASSQSERTINHQQAVYVMESSTSPSPVNSPTLGNNGETPRVKFLCSFGGSILPRPLDGKLRYVGGETRIVSIPRDINFSELMLRMKELFEGATTLKYQQPDEDLDALVSVVNDDDVTNMMEEYDKLGAGDGFTRLRIFLFSNSDNDMTHFDTDERETERRYVDALNSLNDTPGTENKIQGGAEQFLPTPGQPQFNLCLNVPHPSVGQGLHQQSHAARYNQGDVEPPWSPAYYSSVGSLAQDPRLDFPSSPSGGRYRVPLGESHDRLADDYVRQQVNHQYDHQPQTYMENVVWMPPGAVVADKGGFPGNLGPSHGNNSGFEGNSICEHCRGVFQRLPDARWRHGQPHVEHVHMEHLSSTNEFAQFSNPCPGCFHTVETYALNQETEPRTFYNEPHTHERGWVLQQLNQRPEEPRPPLSGAGRINEQYIVETSGINFPLEGHSVVPNCGNQEDSRIRTGADLGSEGYHEHGIGNGHHLHVQEQPLMGGPHVHKPAAEECGICYGNVLPSYGVDNLYQVPHGSPPIQAFRRILPNSIRGGPSYEAAGLIPQTNGTIHTGLMRTPQEGSPRFSCMIFEDKNAWAGQSQNVYGHDGSSVINSNIGTHNNVDLVQPQPGIQDFVVSSNPVLVDDTLASLPVSEHHSTPKNGSQVVSLVRLPQDREVPGDIYATRNREMGMVDEVQSSLSLKKNLERGFDSNHVIISEEIGHTTERNNKPDTHESCKDEASLVQPLTSLPELITSMKRTALEGLEDMKAKAQEDDGSSALNAKDPSQHSVPAGVHMEAEQDSDSENPNTSTIEPTTAEAEALAKGLQTIKNDDLEEIRELGSGTYGAVYHGKWKGSDVAIKRIKASCFSGRPSERERLIADFWKEALILSSLHHPNVVSFYGIVRDGPDGTLATVTEFMVNGSLKQFLQKKDRTIDRRKRLIIAMDAAFGMEYLHGKNIVHFDLKCENLLVNMRDPHRPVCKIGDLGLSKVKQHTMVSGGVRGTLPWMAPELLSGKSNMVSEKIDVYSFGIVMWELLTGEEPYTDMHCASIIGGIVNNTLRPQIPTWCDPEWKSLMESCWSSDPGDRPSFSEISQRVQLCTLRGVYYLRLQEFRLCPEPCMSVKNDHFIWMCHELLYRFLAVT